jgi:zeaxanthin epoxidase
MRVAAVSPLLLVLANVASALRVGSAPRHVSVPRATLTAVATVEPPPTTRKEDGLVPDAISEEAPLHVLIAGAGVGGLMLANCLELSNRNVKYTVLERTQEFRKFGGPIQLASNAMETIRTIDKELYGEIEARATWTGNRTNGIKDGIRNEWYAKFDLKTPAESRGMPFTCVVERPELQEILMRRTGANIRNGAGVESYTEHTNGQVTAHLMDGESVTGDVLIGADGIWSNVRATMTGTPPRGDESGVTYSGYTVFAGELNYGKGTAEHPNVPPVGSLADPECGYKVYIGPQQYFVITDIGRGRYQWYAFLARPADSEASEEKPDGASRYLQDLFEGWSDEIHDILRVTQEHEIEQRDLYDRPPSVLKPWTNGNVGLLGDAIHAMMPNLGQGGCQALEDAVTISEEITNLGSRAEIGDALATYRNRRLTRSAAVQGLSRFASDIIIRGFDTPCKIGFYDGKFVCENLNYAGVVTRMLQPILPIFFAVQFAFLYDGYENRFSLEQLKIGLGFLVLGGLVLAAFAATAGTEIAALGLGVEAGAGAVLGVEGAEVGTTFFAEQQASIQAFLDNIGNIGL